MPATDALDRNRDLAFAVRAQLPAAVVARVKTITTEGDVFLMRVRVRVSFIDGGAEEFALEPDNVEGVTVNVKVPDAVLAKLCLVA